MQYFIGVFTLVMLCALVLFDRRVQKERDQLNLAYDTAIRFGLGTVIIILVALLAKL